MTTFHHNRSILATFLGVVFVLLALASPAEASVGLCEPTIENAFVPCQAFSTSTQILNSIIAERNDFDTVVYYEKEYCVISQHPTTPTYEMITCPNEHPFTMYYKGLLVTAQGGNTNWLKTNLLYIYEGETVIQDQSTYVTMSQPCAVDSRSDYQTGTLQGHASAKCQTALATSTFNVSGTTTRATANLKLEVYLKNSDGKIIDSVSYTYTASGTSSYTIPFTRSFATTTYLVTACVLPAESSSFFGAGTCVSALWGNGMVPFDPLGIYANDTDEVVPTTADIWAENGCDALGLTDVFPALKCAGIWLFYPSAGSVDKMKSLSLKDTFPFSYAYDIGNVRNELFTSVQTGSGTLSATVNLGGSPQVVTFLSKEMLEAVPYSVTIKTLVEYVLWLALAMLIYRRILTVHDTVTP